MEIKKFKLSLIALAIVIVGASLLWVSKTRNYERVLFVGRLDQSAPNVVKAEIVATGKGTFLRVKYRDGIAFPNIDAPLAVNRIGNLYQLQRMDTKERFSLLQLGAMVNSFACTECISDKPGKSIPVLWNYPKNASI